MRSVANMSDMKNADRPVLEGKPNTRPVGLVGLGVKQGKPSAEGQTSTPSTLESKGIAGPLVSCGALDSAECGVEASSPVGVKQGAAYPPVGVKGGKTKQAKQAQQAKSAQLASPAKNAMQQNAQCTVTKSLLPDCNTAQPAHDLSTESILQNVELAHQQGTTKYFLTSRPAVPSVQ